MRGRDFLLGNPIYVCAIPLGLTCGWEEGKTLLLGRREKGIAMFGYESFEKTGLKEDLGESGDSRKGNAIETGREGGIGVGSGGGPVMAAAMAFVFALFEVKGEGGKPKAH